MDKPTRAELIETNRLREAVVAELKKFYPLEVVWRWEQIVHHAASASIEEICRLAGFRAGLVATDSESDETKKLLAGISSILAILVNAEAGKTAAPASTFADLVRILNSMHLDRCEHGIAPEDSEVASAIAECGSPQPSVEEQIALNSMLLVGPLAEGGCPFAPGALYGVDDPGLFKGLLGVEPSDVGRHVLNLAGEPSITDIRRRMKTNGLTANEKATLRVDLTREEDRLLLKYLGLCRPILVEVSPVCDFAQHKRPLARLIAGLAVPPNGVPIARSGDAVWRFETVKIAGLPQPVVLVFSSRFVFGLDAKVVPRGIVQLGRVREVVLSALRHWNAQQASRVGYALVRPAD
jgi:hypothetical protein